MADNIYTNALQLVRSPEQVQAGLAQNALAQAQLQHSSLAAQQMQTNMDAETRLRAELSRGTDPRTPEGQAAIMRADPIGGMKIQQQLLEQDKLRAETDKSKGQTAEAGAKTTNEALKSYRSVLTPNMTPDQFTRWAGALYKDPRTADAVTAQFGPPEGVQARIAAIAADPKKWPEFVQANAMGMDEFIKNQTTRQNSVDTNATHVQTTAMTNATSRANNAATQAGENARLKVREAGENARAGMGPDGAVAPGSEEATIKALGEYRMKPPTLQALRNPRIAAMMDKVNAAYPEYDATQFDMRQKAVKDFATGKQGQEVQSANTAVNHIGTLRDLAEAQKNGDVRMVNDVLNRLGKEFGTTAPSNLQAAVTLVGPEISKAVIGAGGGQGDREKVDAALAGLVKGGPAQAAGTIATLEDIFGGRLTEAQRTYERSTKMKDFETSLLSPAAQKVLERRKSAAAPAAPKGLPSGWKIEKVGN